MRTKVLYGLVYSASSSLHDSCELRDLGYSPLNPSHPLELVLYKDDSINRTHIRRIILIT